MDSGTIIAIILLALSLAALIVIPIQLFKSKKLTKQLSDTSNQLSTLKAVSNDLQTKIDSLIKYEKIEDAQKEAERILLNANKAANDSRTAVRKEKERADAEVTAIKTSARKEAKDIREKAQAVLDNAIKERTRILDSANQQATEIAGDAIKAKNNADQYSKTARAMQNIIKGYGDEYLIPNRSLLDELADDFEHKEAGEKLKEARKRTKEMIKNGLAATCEYVEKHRKITAVRFVLDAFNGKVDTILAKVKHNNYGKLKQEINDAFSLVNGNGKAFRDARIYPEYLEARLTELDWAVKANELKLEEREEQRRIKEEMREEEKARREYEKAIKAAAKEEKLLQDAMKKARQELEAASDEQRSNFEAQLAELQAKLEEAESKNERALSMAQQTKRGHVYVISNVGSFGEDVFKIGLTRRLEPLDRVRELGDASVPFPFDVHAMIYSEDAPNLEKELHRTFELNQMNKVNPRKEFFQVGINEIREIVDSRGLEAKWTMKAEAAQYRESLTLAQAESQQEVQEAS